LIQIRRAPATTLNRLPQPLTILCIDDDPAILKLYEWRLAACGARVLCTADGRHGFSSAIESSPDLILLDNDLPDEKGVDLVGRLRSHPATADIHILMLTGSRTPALQRCVLMNAAVEVLQKPVNFPELIDTICRLTASRCVD
jgi:DNA-binding response OmpR family regulator